MTIADAPRVETGYPAGVIPAYTMGQGAGYVLESLDFNVDLRFPASAVVYDRMGREDGQTVSVIRAIVQAITAAKRTLGGDDVRPEVKAFITAELGLDLNEGRSRRRRQGIVHRRHRRESAAGMLRYGFLPFEQTYTVGPANPGQPDDPERRQRLGTDLYAHLSRLSSRNPRTLMDVVVDEQGSLLGVIQQPRPGRAEPRGVFIPVAQLVWYAFEQEGADYTGNSALRGAYKHWLVKDALIRVGAQVVERNGMGIPVVDHAPGYRGQALRLSTSLRAGATAGVALERDKLGLTMMGVTGNVVDGLPWVKYHDEAIGRSLLAMILNLGHDNGARALGQTFADVLAGFINSINGELDEVDTEHIIRDLVELNYGPDEPYPVLVTEEITAAATAETLKALADAGLITPDDVTEADVRRRVGLPPADLETRRLPVMAERGPTPQNVDATDQGGAILPVTDPEDVALERLAHVAGQLAALRAGHGADG